MKTKIKGIFLFCLLFTLACAPEDDILQNSINVYPEINIRYYNTNDSLVASVNFHSINSFGQSIKLIDESSIFYNNNSLKFDTIDGSYTYSQIGRPDSNIVSWFHDGDFYSIEMDMNTFDPTLNNNPLKLDQSDSIFWMDKSLELSEYTSFYAGDNEKTQYHFNNEYDSNAMLIDSAEIKKLYKDSLIFIAPVRVKQFEFDLKSYRGSTGATRIYGDTIFTKY